MIVVMTVVTMVKAGMMILQKIIRSGMMNKGLLSLLLHLLQDHLL
jgi:hypothetical protein